ncbi:MraY family glycosyltransferase [Chryseobacterium sp.]|uniref:MraY family glycosyltransferase n=1 Tax=Chryseobacterium sp. TaxID=1871047 RepID=UPI0011CC1834|nr:glycosyltransferase family 4 protein [Chryseobacterium sp.]TXF77563.1 glycosyltransferase family 4 protein [Chryseobacterium sp.]
MEYLISAFILFLVMLQYFRIADRYNIIDRPNSRSAHSEITIRGGGIVFPVAFLLLFTNLFFNEILVANLSLVVFGVGLFIICSVSFADDLVDLSTRIRLLFQFAAVSFLLYFLSVFQLFPMWLLPGAYIVTIGILNAYNFMDGINGMTGLYSVVVLLSLFYINRNLTEFTIPEFIIYPMIACVVFLFFNFRSKAKCFMGDVGSLGIAFWVTALIGLLMIKTGQLKWILFLSIYGIEVIATIAERLRLRENILKAHRRHLYQLMANERKVSHLVVSVFYAMAQVIVNILVIYLELPEWQIFAVVLIPAASTYLFIKYSLKKKLRTRSINENSRNSD